MALRSRGLAVSTEFCNKNTPSQPKPGILGLPSQEIPWISTLSPPGRGGEGGRKVLEEMKIKWGKFGAVPPLECPKLGWTKKFLRLSKILLGGKPSLQKTSSMRKEESISSQKSDF